MRALVEEADEAALHGDADHQHDRNCHDDGDGYGIFDQGVAEIAEPMDDIGRFFD